MKKQIYITALHLAHGGIEMAISLMSNAFIKKGYDVTILSLYNLCEPAYSISSEVKIEYLTDVRPNKEEFLSAVKSKNPLEILKEGFYALKVLRLKKSALIKRIKQINDGIIISTRNEHSVLLSKYGNEKVLKIAQLHHDHCFDKALLSDIKNRYENIDYFTLLTDLLTQEIQELISPVNRKTRCVTMENFLDKCEFNVDLSEKEKSVVAVGRLHSVKGFDRLLKIWKEAVSNHSDWKLYIVGDGEEEQKLTDLANNLKISDSVIFTGALPHDRVLSFMERSSVYTMTSYSEGFPFVLIEAMSCGLPVIAFDVRVGPRAIINDGANGILVEDNDIKAFADALCSLMDNAELRLEYSKNALERAKSFTEDKVVEKWISVFEDL
ncbi:MAG: glycosyltransferase family 4 protein [Acutalibacteraceae bacterium]|nr:glycosyltransferase family 4 protein [Acutalibacteraceae bacterium]